MTSGRRELPRADVLSAVHEPSGGGGGGGARSRGELSPETSTRLPNDLVPLTQMSD